MPLSRQTSRIVWPSKPSTTRPSTSIRIRGVDCGRCGDWVVSRRSASESSSGCTVFVSTYGRGRRSVIVSSGGCAGRDRDGSADAGGAGAPQDVLVQLGSEVLHPAREREGGESLVIAEGGADDVAGEIREQIEVGRLREAGRDSVADLADPTQADPARDRLAARLVGAEPGEEPSEVHDACPLVRRYDRAGADVRADRAERLELV